MIRKFKDAVATGETDSTVEFLYCRFMCCFLRACAILVCLALGGEWPEKIKRVQR